MIDTVVWDWNGTLLDDLSVSFEATNRLLRANGLQPLADLDRYRSVFSFPVIDYYRRIGLGPERFSFDKLAQQVLGLPVRVGVPPMQKGSALGLVSPEDATVVGVLLETMRRRRLAGGSKHKSGRFDGVLGVVRRIMFGDFSG